VVSLPPGTFAPYSDVKTALIFFERPGPTREVWYYELPLPEGLKKFSKGSPIQDEHFKEARELYKAWDAYRKSQGPREACLSERSWIVPVEEIRARGYDLTARNPNRKETEALPAPMEIVASLLEREREILSIVEELDELLRGGGKPPGGHPAVCLRSTGLPGRREPMTEGPYKLPEGWRWVRLGEVCEVWDTLRKPVKKKDRIPGDVPYCGANGIIDYVDGYTHAGEFVLLAEDGGFYGPGEPTAYIMSGRFWANNHVHILRGRPDHLVNQLLYYCLVAYDLRPFLTGATRPKLTQAAMRSIPIPLPPLDEQRWIVAHLEAVQEKVRALKEAQAETDEELKRLERSILDKAFRGEL